MAQGYREATPEFVVMPRHVGVARWRGVMDGQHVTVAVNVRIIGGASSFNVHA